MNFTLINYFLVMVFSISSMHIRASELSKGGSPKNAEGAQSAEEDSETSQSGILGKNTIQDCPETLKNWVQDDFENKKSFFNILDFPSEAKSCRTSVEAYKNFYSKKGVATELQQPGKLVNYLSDKFQGTIHPSLKNNLAGCQSLPVEQATAIQTRFYAASSKLDSALNAQVGELAYIDTILPPGKPAITDIKCTPYLPELQKKCNSLKNRVCTNTVEKRFKQQVDKTKKILEKVGLLSEAKKSCTRQVLKDSTFQNSKEQLALHCAPIQTAIDQLNTQVPWINGEEFKKIAAVKGPSVFDPDQSIKVPDAATVEKALKKQLETNRKSLADQFNEGQNDFNCISNSGEKKNCDFDAIRKNLSKIPDITTTTIDQRKPADRELGTYLNAEECISRRALDRKDVKTIYDGYQDAVTETAYISAATALTGGVGAVIAASERGAVALNRAVKIRKGLLLGSSALVSGGYATRGLNGAFKECQKETKSVGDLVTSSGITKDNLCSDATSTIEQAKDAENDCLVNALLATADVLPFLGSAFALVKFAKPLTEAEKLALLSKIKDPKQREFVEKALAQNAKIGEDDAERIRRSEALVGKLSPEKKACINSAHLVAAEKKSAGYGTYTAGELLEKKGILQDCGFSPTDISLLMRSGLTGKQGSGSKNNLLEDLQALDARNKSNSATTQMSENDITVSVAITRAREVENASGVIAQVKTANGAAKSLATRDPVIAKGFLDDGAKRLAASDNARKIGQPNEISAQMAAKLYASADDSSNLKYALQKQIEFANSDPVTYYGTLEKQIQTFKQAGGTGSDLEIFILRRQQQALYDDFNAAAKIENQYGEEKVLDAIGEVGTSRFSQSGSFSNSSINGSEFRK